MRLPTKLTGSLFIICRLLACVFSAVLKENVSGLSLKVDDENKDNDADAYCDKITDEIDYCDKTNGGKDYYEKNDGYKENESFNNENLYKQNKAFQENVFSGENSDYNNLVVNLDAEADAFAEYYRSEIEQLATEINVYEFDTSGLTWNVINLFFATTSALEACSFSSFPGIPVGKHKYVICGLGLSGIVFNSAAIFIKTFDTFLEENASNSSYYFNNNAFNSETYDVFAANTINLSLREKYPKVFEHIDKFKETETYSKFLDLGIKIQIDSTLKSYNSNTYTNYLVSLDTPAGIGSLHGINLKFNINRYLVKMMANSRYVNMPTDLIKKVFKMMKQNNQMIKKGEIKNFIVAVAQAIGEESSEYVERAKTLFEALGEEDLSDTCQKKKFAYRIQDPKQNAITVMDVSGYVKC